LLVLFFYLWVSIKRVFVSGYTKVIFIKRKLAYKEFFKNGISIMRVISIYCLIAQNYFKMAQKHAENAQNHPKMAQKPKVYIFDLLTPREIIKGNKKTGLFTPFYSSYSAKISSIVNFKPKYTNNAAIDDGYP
jgi:hypothetical protein